MSNPANGAPAANLGPLPRHRERAECDARDPVVITRPAAPAGHGIALMECAAAGLDLRTWWERNRGLLHDCRRQHGAVLIRGCHVGGAEVFYALMQALDSRAMTYVERSSPRRLVYGSVYTSTEYPADQSIFPHNENSYAGVWPLHIAFYCVRPAARGGATPIVDCRRMLTTLAPTVVERFRRSGVLYVRNFREELGVSWRDAFAVTTRAEAELYCQRAGYEWRWMQDGTLRTRRQAPAIVCHRHSGEPVWFNHAAFFNVAALPPAVSASLLARYEPLELPNNTYYGDGAPIEASVVEEIQHATARCTLRFQWQADDILLLDNMLMAHGRDPFTGARSVLVNMTDPVYAGEVAFG